MSLFSGTRTTDKDIYAGIQREVKRIVLRYERLEIDGPDLVRLLVDLLVKASNAKARPRVAREVQ